MGFVSLVPRCEDGGGGQNEGGGKTRGGRDLFLTPLKEDGEDSFRREFHQTFQMKERRKKMVRERESKNEKDRD